MSKNISSNNSELIKIINKGGIGIFPTDTLYGLMGKALLQKTVERIYKVRQRNPQKPCIILISSFSDLKLFGIKIDKKTRDFLKKVWPGKVSVVLECMEEKFSYLHRGTKTLALRFPQEKNILKILKKTGPLISPSANPEGKSPAINTKEAENYFGQEVDFYVDAGKLKSKPSTLVLLKNGKAEILRQGSVKIKNLIKKHEKEN